MGELKNWVLLCSCHADSYITLSGILFGRSVHMARFLHHDFFLRRRKAYPFYLAFGWVIGLMLGFSLSHHEDSFSSAWMRMTDIRSASIVGLMGVTLFPLLLSAFAVYICQYWMLPMVAAAKAFSFGYLLWGAAYAYGSALWLAYPLLCFSEVISLPVLWLFWLRHGRQGGISKRSLIYPAVLCAATCIDIGLISPFFAGL